MQVLHIIPHMGGGAGKVCRNLVAGLDDSGQNIHQRVMCFEKLNPQAREWSRQAHIDIEECLSPEDTRLIAAVERADIVHVHFWNHPALYRFFSALSGRHARVVLWSYVNGVNGSSFESLQNEGTNSTQTFTSEVVSFGSLFVVSTPYSFGSPCVRNHPQVRNIFMTAGISGFENIVKAPHEIFRLGYVGTVAPCKLHEDIISICKLLAAPQREYIFCGGPQHQILEKRAAAEGLQTFVKVMGNIDNVASALSMIDLFVYPLRRDHYGTGEQVLIEAMAAGIPQIVFGGSAESFVVQSETTGFVVCSIAELVEAVRQVEANPGLRQQLAQSSRKLARERFSIRALIEEWVSLYKELLEIPKKKCRFIPAFQEQFVDDAGAMLFLTSLGKGKVQSLYAKAFLFRGTAGERRQLVSQLQRLPPIFHEKTRGSLRHYAAWFPESEHLQYALALCDSVRHEHGKMLTIS